MYASVLIKASTGFQMVIITNKTFYLTREKYGFKVAIKVIVIIT